MIKIDASFSVCDLQQLDPFSAVTGTYLLTHHEPSLHLTVLSIYVCPWMAPILCTPSQRDVSSSSFVNVNERESIASALYCRRKAESSCYQSTLAREEDEDIHITRGW